MSVRRWASSVGLAAILASCGGAAVPSGASPSVSTAAPTPQTSSAPLPTPVPTAVPPIPVGSRGPASIDPARAPAVVDLTCTDGAPTISDPAVRAQPDGAHVRVAGGVGREVSFETAEGRDSRMVDAEGQVLVLPIAPGDALLRCQVPAPADLPGTALQVVDPAGAYRDPTITASGTCATGEVGYGEGARGIVGDFAQIVRSRLHGLRAGDIVQVAGYATDTEQTVRVVRDGLTIGRIGGIADGAGGWLIGSTALCAGLRID